MRKILELGGVLAAVVLIAFGIGAIVAGLNGRDTVHSTLQQEKIVGSPDMTPAAIKAEAKQAEVEAGEATSYSSEPTATEDGGSLASDEALQALREKLTGGGN